MRTDSGFTLIEVLVALVILSATVGVVVAVVRQGAVASKTTVTREVVLSEMGSLFRRIGRDIELEDGRAEGRFPSGALWQIKTEPYMSANIKDRQAQIHLVKVSIAATWSTRTGNRREELTSLRLKYGSPR